MIMHEYAILSIHCLITLIEQSIICKQLFIISWNVMKLSIALHIANTLIEQSKHTAQFNEYLLEQRIINYTIFQCFTLQ